MGTTPFREVESSVGLNERVVVWWRRTDISANVGLLWIVGVQIRGGRFYGGFGFKLLEL